MKKITFHLGAEKQIKISTAGHSDSLFYEGYRQALAGVIEIVRASSGYVRDWDDLSRRGDKALRTPYYSQTVENGSFCGGDKDFYNFPSNLLVFTGGRGTGKSSAMLTFVDSLGKKESQLFSREFVEDMVRYELPGMVASAEEQAVSAVYDLLRETVFLPLSPIDPTTLEEDGQILINILARMFQKAQEAWDSRFRDGADSRMRDAWDARIRDAWNIQAHEGQPDLNQKDQLMRQFAACYESVTALRNKDIRREEFDGLDLLERLGDSSRLKKQLAELVEQLLRFCCPKGGKNAYLVLQIDDTDMNIQHAYSILEDLRRYLVIPRLIIVMAADLNHLTQVVKGSFLRSYGKELPNMDEYIRAITAQYVSKLIPLSRRICLPEVGVYLKEHPETEIRYMAGEAKVLPDKNKAFQDSQEQIFRLIYRKTGMIFLLQENRLHYIIPDNMRLLSYFLAMLVQMPDVADPDAPTAEFFLPDIHFMFGEPGKDVMDGYLSTIQKRLQNIQRFRDYFFTIWANNNLLEEHARFLRGLSEANLSNKTRMVCVKMGWTEDSAYADMIRILRDKERGAVGEEERKFIFAIHMYFSLLAHSIVLEELISYYDKPFSEQKGCVFMRLYPVFGSRIFSYVEKKDFEGLKIRENEYAETRAAVAVWNEEEFHYIRWRLSAEMGEEKISHFAQIPEQNPKFLYSMLCPYDQSESQRVIWADFSTPIVNSLYLCQSKYVTPLANKAITNRTAVSSIEKMIWPRVQESALMIVLNWDVQQKLGSYLFKKSESPRNHRRLYLPRERGDLLACLRAFYTALDGENARSDTGRFPVACAGRTELYNWLVGLSFDGDTVNEGWRQMTRNFYNREPIPDPAEGTEGTGEDGAHFNGAEASGNTAVESTASDGGTAGETACLGDELDCLDEDIGKEFVDEDPDGEQPGADGSGEVSENTAVGITASDGVTAGEAACLGDSPDSIDEDIGNEPVDKDQDGGEPGVPKE